MSKKLTGLLLAICLIVGLLPVTALAADGTAQVIFGSTKVNITGYDTPVYYKNASGETKDIEGNTFTYWYAVKGSETDWNAKFEWKSGDATPTLTLNGFRIDEWNETTEKLRAAVDDKGNYQYDGDGNIQAMATHAITVPEGNPMTIVLTGEDSYLGCMHGLTYYSDLTIQSEGDTKLVVDSYHSGISNDTTAARLTINANLDVTIKEYLANIGNSMIQANGADLIINGGNINLDTPVDYPTYILGIAAYGSGVNVVINAGTINANNACTPSHRGVIHSEAGKVIINGGDITLTPKFSMGIYANKGIEINGGTTNIISTYYGVHAGSIYESADITVNGGTLEINAKNACYKAPTLGPNVTAFVGAGRNYAELYDAAVVNMYKKAWMIMSSEQLDITTKPTYTPVIPTQPVTTPTTAPTTVSTQAPTGNGQTDSSSDSYTILWITAVAVIAIASTAVILIIIKRKKN